MSSRIDLVQHYASLRDKTIVDVGAGMCEDSLAACTAGASRVDAYELRERALRYLPSPVPSSLRVIREDARALTDDTTYDITFCFGFLYHLSNPFHFLKRLRAVTTDWLF